MGYGNVFHGSARLDSINNAFKGTDDNVPTGQIPILYDFDINDSTEIFKVKCRYNEIAGIMARNAMWMTGYDGQYPLTPNGHIVGGCSWRANGPVLVNYAKIIRSLNGKPSNVTGCMSTTVSAFCIHGKQYNNYAFDHSCQMCHDDYRHE